jgi:type I restriction enzyme S subunit
MIPAKWKQMPLVDIAQIQTGLAKGKKNIKNSVCVPYLRVANVQDGYLDLSRIKSIEVDKSAMDKYLLKPGDVLLTEGGDFDKLGRGTIWQGEISPCLHQNHIFVARPKERMLMPEFLSLLTGSDHGKTYFLKCSKQSTNLASINSTQLKQFPVLLPPLEEQQQITSIMTTWDQIIEKTERLIAAKEKRYSHLVNSLIVNNRHHREHIRDFATQVSKRNSGAAIDRVLSVTNNNGFVLPENQFERRVASSDLSHYKVVTRGQYAYNPSRINVGSIARLDEWDKGVLSPMYVVFEINKKKVNSDFFLHWLESHEAKERIRKSAQGSVRETVSFTDLGTISFPLPALDKQIAVAATLNITRKEINLLKKQVDAYRTQKRGLMQKLLTGQWRTVGARHAVPLRNAASFEQPKGGTPWNDK